jgi:SIR2-like domain
MINSEKDILMGGRDTHELSQELDYQCVYLRSDSHIAKLKEDIKTKKFVLFLGAGVSWDFKTPDWDTLLERLYSDKDIFNIETEELWTTIKENVLKGKLRDALQQGRMIELQCQSKGVDFKTKVKHHLYKDNTESKGVNATLNLIGEFLLENILLDSIVTFNFDDYAEAKLSEKAKNYRTIHKESDLIALKSDELPVYHPHGYLPSETVDVSVPEYSIVFSETAYHQTYSEPYSWANLTQINKLTNYTCIFIGISLNDPNMRRLLDVAKKTNPTNSHYTICTKNKNPDEALNRIVDGSFESYARSLNLHTIYIDSYGPEFRKLLNELTT